MQTSAPALKVPVAAAGRRDVVVPNFSRMAITALLVCLLIPRGVEVRLGSIVIDASRVLLLIFGAGAFFRWALRGVNFRLTVCDYLMAVHVGLIAFSAVYHEGLGDGLERAISMMLFNGVAYGIARVTVRHEATFAFYVRMMLIVAAISGVFGAIEMVTGFSPIRAAYNVAFPAVQYVYLDNKRLSLFRATATFRADILLGLFCVIAVALTVFMKPKQLRMHKNQMCACQFLAFVGIFSSLSSGPWLATALMVACIVYDRVTRGVPGRWIMLVGACAIGFGLLHVVSPTGAFGFLINRMTLNPASGHVRLAMWESVLALVPTYWPIGWGWGSDWPRAVDWYTWASIDSYYCVYFVRSGIFTLIALVAFYLIAWTRAGTLTHCADRVAAESKGWILATVCLALVAITVHIFGNLIYAMYLMLGAGQWLVEAAPAIQARRRTAGRTTQPVSPVRGRR